LFLPELNGGLPGNGWCSTEMGKTAANCDYFRRQDAENENGLNGNVSRDGGLDGEKRTGVR